MFISPPPLFSPNHIVNLCKTVPTNSTVAGARTLLVVVTHLAAKKGPVKMPSRLALCSVLLLATSLAAVSAHLDHDNLLSHAQVWLYGVALYVHCCSMLTTVHIRSTE